jgi:hypothetical protein
MVARVAQFGQLIAARVPPAEIIRWATQVTDKDKTWIITEGMAKRFIALAYQGWDREDADDKDLIKARVQNRRTGNLLVKMAIQQGDVRAGVAALKLLAELEGTLEPAPIQINLGAGDLPTAVAAIRHASSTLDMAIRRGAIAASVIDASATELPAAKPADVEDAELDAIVAEIRERGARGGEGN